jgi:hypothetical protein
MAKDKRTNNDLRVHSKNITFNVGYTVLTMTTGPPAQDQQTLFGPVNFSVFI